MLIKKTKMENIDIPVVDKNHTLPTFYGDIFHNVSDTFIKGWINEILDNETFVVIWVCKRKTSEFPVFIINDFINIKDLGNLVKNIPQMESWMLDKIKEDCMSYKIIIRNAKHVKTYILNDKVEYGPYPVFVSINARKLDIMAKTKREKGKEHIINKYFADMDFDIMGDED